MVDIHSHILWGMDDGAETREESAAMMRLAAESGTTDIVATPHANNQYKFDAALVRERAADLREVSGGQPRIHLGCDFHLSFTNIEDALADPAKFTINGLGYLMVELPEVMIPPNMGHVFERMRQVGIYPVITHPERNRAIWVDDRNFDSWLELGCYAQITGQSLEGGFGRTAKEIAWRLLDEEKAHFVASDGHDPEHRPPRLDRSFSLVARKFGEEFATRLFVENPGRVLTGSPLEFGKVQRQKSRFRLFR